MNEQPVCHMCGSKRQRNLKRHMTLFLAKAKIEYTYTCKRCQMLIDEGISKDELRYTRDLLFGKPEYRYANQKQINKVRYQ